MSEQGKFSSIDIIGERLEQHRYITDQSLATVIYLAYHLRKPVFLEGEPGVGKTEVALVLSEILATKLIRLQCYEGLDANSALYEWNYPKQLLRIKMDEQCGLCPPCRMETNQIVHILKGVRAGKGPGYDQKLEKLESLDVHAVVAGDVSCLMQIDGRLKRRGSKVRTLHLAELLADTGSPSPSEAGEAT